MLKSKWKQNKAKGSKKANGYFEKAKKADTDTDTETDTDTDTDIDTETDTDIKQVVVVVIAEVEERARGNLPVDNLFTGCVSTQRRFGKVLAKHLFVCYTSTLHTRRIVSTHGMGSGKSAKRAGIFGAHVEINVTANNRS